MKPIYDHRRLVGYAKTSKQAERVLRKMLQHIPPGWKISVKERDCSVVDLPPGFVYSVHP